MKLHHQPTFNHCWSTCVACLLDVEPSAIPNFVHHGHDWFDHAQAWLNARGLGLVVWAPQADPTTNDLYRDCVFIASGPSPLDPSQQHAVLWKRGQLFHDPNPANLGLVCMEELDALFVMDLDLVRRSFG